MNNVHAVFIVLHTCTYTGGFSASQLVESVVAVNQVCLVISLSMLQLISAAFEHSVLRV